MSSLSIRFPAAATLLLIALTYLGFRPQVQAQLTQFNVNSGDWQTASLWSNGLPGAASNARIEKAGDITAILSTGAAFSIYNLHVGFTTGLGGHLLIQNARTLNVSNDTHIGYSGTGTVFVTGASTLNTSRFITLGNQVGGNGSAKVSGAGSLLQAGAVLELGVGGEGTLRVEAGGKAKSNSLYAGEGTTGRGTITITGTNAVLETNSLLLGQNGYGSLYVENGGYVNQTGASNTAQIGSDRQAAEGHAVVTGENSLWSITSYLNVGSLGTGTLTVDDGGVVKANNVNVAMKTGSNGTVTLNGNATRRGVLETGQIAFGTSTSDVGTGAVYFDGGILRATGNTSSFMIVNAAYNGYYVRNGGAYIDTGSYSVSTGSGRFVDAVGHNGGLTKLGSGSLTLQQNHTYSGNTTVQAGFLILANLASIPNTPRIEVNSGATFSVNAMPGGWTQGAAQTLAGTGTVLGIVYHQGTISPGASGAIGQLKYTGNQAWLSGGTYQWQVSALTGTAGTQWDHLNITGLLSFNSTSSDRFNIQILGSLNTMAENTQYDWTIATTTTGFNVSFAANKFNLDASQFSSNLLGTWSILTSGNNLVLRYAATVPEPGRATLLLLGIVAGTLRRRRQGLL